MLNQLWSERVDVLVVVVVARVGYEFITCLPSQPKHSLK